MKRGTEIAQERLLSFFTHNGYWRAGTVREPGEFAIRGGIVDVYPPGEETPLRLDFFGDDPPAVTRRGYIDDVIEPSQTRPRLINALNMLQNKRDENPPKKHGNIPL